MFPIINIGPAAVQAPGLILMLSLFLGIWLTGKLSAGLGTNTDAIENSILIGLIAGIVGARIGFLLKNTAVFLSNPASLFSLTPSMLDTSFGLLVGVLTALILAQKKHLPLWPSLDSLTPLLILLFSGIHMANFASGNAYGLPTTLPWGIQLWNAARHPVQVYAILLAAGLFVWMLIHTQLLRSTGFMRSGILFSISLVGIAVITLFTRAFVAEKFLFGNLDLIQFLALLILIGSLGMISAKAFPSRQKHSALISMGSNQNPHQKLSVAQDQLSNEFRIRRKSSRYLTKDFTGDHQTADFLNQVIEIETDLPYHDLVAQLKAIEQALGREPGNKKQVALDLDLLTYGSEVFTTGGRRIPAPDMLKYRYIALPLAEMSPDFRHPANGISVQEILDKISDESSVIINNEVDHGIKE